MLVTGLYRARLAEITAVISSHPKSTQNRFGPFLRSGMPSRTLQRPGRTYAFIAVFSLVQSILEQVILPYPGAKSGKAARHPPGSATYQAFAKVRKDTCIANVDGV